MTQFEKAPESRRISTGEGVEVQKKNFEIEIEKERFDFTLLPSAQPSHTLVIHFPGFTQDGEEYAEPMHYETGQSHTTLTFKEYGENYSKAVLTKAIEQALEVSDMRNQIIVLHGTSFGSSVIYDLISDPEYKEFLDKIGVAGVIMETPVLDKSHLNAKYRSLPDDVLVSGAAKLADLSAIRRENKPLDEARFTELLREKTIDKKITIPVHVVFAAHDRLVDNRKIADTLRNQSAEFTSQVVPSASSRAGHHVAEYESTWNSEKKVIDDFGQRPRPVT